MTPETLPGAVEAWRDRGQDFSFRGQRVHYFHQAGEGPLTVLLHGFPTSSFDWVEVIDLMPDHELLAPDFLGFGFSDKPREHVYTLAWQADLVEALVDQVGDGRSVVILAHDLGTSVATELMARDLEGELGFQLDGVLLFNGSVMVERANPTLAQKLLVGPLGPLAARLSNEAFFRRQFSSVFSTGHPPSEEFLADSWSLIALNGGHRIGHRLVHYMEERTIYADRWHGAVRDWEGDFALVWGMEDPVAVPEILDGLVEMRPAVEPVRFDDLGHYPQVEDASRWVGAVEGLLDGAQGRK